jgi:hypothetical protein
MIEALSIAPWLIVFPAIAQPLDAAAQAKPTAQLVAVLDEVKKEADGLGFQGEGQAGFFDGKGCRIEDEIVQPIADSWTMHRTNCRRGAP